MSLKKAKTKIQPYNTSRKHNFLLQIQLENDFLEVVYSTRVLGVQFNSNLRWDDHVNEVTKRAKQKTWLLRRLKKFGASEEKLVELYILFVRSGIEFASPLWSNGLTKSNLNKLERIQARITDLIIGPNDLSYIDRLKKLRIIKLEERFQINSARISDKMIRDPRFQFLFPRSSNTMNTRNKNVFVETMCKTNRLYFSAIPSFIRAQNLKHKQA